MKIKFRAAGFIMVALITSCCIPFGTSDTNDSKTQTKDSSSVEKHEKKEKVIDGIHLVENGLTVKECGLYTVDDKPTNLTMEHNLGEKIRLKLDVHGWNSSGVSNQCQCSTKITANDGEVVLLDSPQLMEKPTKVFGSSIELTLYALSENRTFDKVKVEFRVWDVESNADVSGYYILKLKIPTAN